MTQEIRQYTSSIEGCGPSPRSGSFRGPLPTAWADRSDRRTRIFNAEFSIAARVVAHGHMPKVMVEIPSVTRIAYHSISPRRIWRLDTRLAMPRHWLLLGSFYELLRVPGHASSTDKRIIYPRFQHKSNYFQYLRIVCCAHVALPAFRATL